MTNEPLKATQPLPYECFQDRSYYDMWCVRRVNEREWGKGFHLVNGEEAAALRDLLNTRAPSHHDLIEALREARTGLSITRTNVMTEIGRCADESRSPWAGVPEQLAKRIAKIDAILTKVEAGQ